MKALRHIGRAWDQVDPDRQIHVLRVLATLTIGACVAGALTWARPAAWMSGVAVGCSVSSVLFFAQALFAGPSSER